MLYKQQITVHQAIKRMCVKSMLHTFAVYSHCGSSCSAEVCTALDITSQAEKYRAIDEQLPGCGIPLHKILLLQSKHISFSNLPSVAYRWNMLPCV